MGDTASAAAAALSSRNWRRVESILAGPFIVGRTPWSAADAPVGFSEIAGGRFGWAKSRSRGTRADQGVRPTSCGEMDHLAGPFEYGLKQHIGPAGAVFPAAELFGRVADPIHAGDENHAHRS